MSRARGPAWDGVLLAFAGPALAVAATLVRHRAAGGLRVAAPPSWAGRLLLAGRLAANALVEELLWRAPLTRLRPGGVRLFAGTAGAAAFVGLHLRRDGARALPVHALTTASWTAAALLDRRLRWPVVSHTAYNYAAVVLRPATETGR